jgi:hypothetical protein
MSCGGQARVSWKIDLTLSQHLFRRRRMLAIGAPQLAPALLTRMYSLGRASQLGSGSSSLSLGAEIAGSE